jgi:hypothetical protein
LNRTAAPLGLALLALIAGCSHAPRLDSPRANHQRDLVSSQCPQAKTHELVGTVGGVDRPLAEWAKKAGPGDTIDVKLIPGVYTIEEPIVVKGANLVIRGAGYERSRIRLDSDDMEALTVKDGSFELRGVTIAGYTGGGISVDHCQHVVVNECDFAGSTYGLSVASSVALVDSCCFAGCYRGIAVDGGSLVVRGTSFIDSWYSIEGKTKLEAFGCAFFGNENGASLRAARGSTIKSCLFARNESLTVTGELPVTSSLLYDDLLERYHKQSDADKNKPIRDIEQFPDALPEDMPRGSNLAPIHYAIARAQLRGKTGVAAAIKDTLEGEARYYERGAQAAIDKNDRGAAKILVGIALDYVTGLGGDRELETEIEAILAPPPPKTPDSSK